MAAMGTTLSIRAVSDTKTMPEQYSVIDLRAELGISQWALAGEAKLNQSTISDIENGERTRKVTAHKIWHAINRLRAQHELPPLAFEDISWNLQ